MAYLVRMVCLCLLLGTMPSVSADWRTALPGAQRLGEGDFTWFGLRLYSARLWAVGPVQNWSQPFALELTYHRSLSRDTLVQASLQEMRRLGGGSVTARQITAWSETMAAAFVDVRPDRCLLRSASSGSCQSAFEPADRAAHDRKMLVQQCTCIEVVLMKMDTFTPSQIAASLQADRPVAGQSGVAKLQGPAQVAFAGQDFMGTAEGIANVVGVRIQLGEVGPQGLTPLNLMQGITKGDVVGVQFFQPMETTAIEVGEALGELLQVG